MVLTKEDLSEWNNHPVTKQVMLEVRKTLVDVREISPLSSSAFETAQKAAGTEGFINGVNAFFDAYQDVKALAE